MLKFTEPEMADPLVVWLVAFVAGAGLAVVIWRMLAPTFAQPLFARTNHRGASVPVAAGIVLVLAGVVVAGVWRFVNSLFGWINVGADVLISTVLIAGGFALLGLFDDLASQGDDRGFRGHVGALLNGRLTTGAVKLLGGGFFALMVSPLSGGRAWWQLALGAAVIALAANTANLLDRAPARCTKVALVCTVVLLVTCGSLERPWLSGVVLIMGAAVGLVGFDARERLMLGDTGSNVLGAVLGWGLVATTGWVVQLVVLVVLIALNLASEKVSFSKVIEANTVLRTIDRFGRPPAP